MGTFLHVNTPAMLHLRAYPPGYVLGSGVERKQFVEIAMVKIAVYLLLYLAEIHYHPLGIELTGATMDGYNPVMTMLTGAFALIWQRQAVGT
jgi:hypothetical protein